MAVGFRRSIFGDVLERRGDVNTKPIIMGPKLLYFENIPSDMYVVSCMLVWKVDCGCHFAVEPSLVAL